MELKGLIAGLGNPGKEYAATRHNYGFMLVEALLEECGRLGQVSALSGQKDPFRLWRCSLRGGFNADWLVATPLTFMNKSGEAVQQRARWVVRVMTSLLSFPGRDADDERTMLTEFVVPVVVSPTRPSLPRRA